MEKARIRICKNKGVKWMALRVKQEERSQEYKDKMEAEAVLFILATGGKR